MYTIIVVDDEPLIREGIRDYINSTNKDFIVVEDFKNAVKALEYLKDNHVDVVITDIKMPIMSGVEFAEQLYKSSPEIITVVISGFKEFEYAHKVMQMDVKYYLLKPLKLDEVNNTLKGIKQTLAEREKEQKLKEMANDINDGLIREYLFDCITGAKKNKARISDTVTKLTIAPNAYDYPCCIIRVDYSKCMHYVNDKWNYGKENFTNVLINILKSENKNLSFYQFLQINEAINVFSISRNSMPAEDFENEMTGCLTHMHTTFQELWGLDVESKVLKYFKNFISIIEEENCKYIGISGELPLEMFKGIISHVNDQDYEGTRNLLNSFFDAITDIPIEYSHGLILNIYNTLFSNSTYEVLKDKYTMGAVLKTESLCDLKILCEKLIEDLLKLENGNDDKQEIIINAKRFIDENYMMDISLSDVADYVFLSPAYFSRVFRGHTGESFTDYLIRIRMEQAISLIKSKHKVNDISAAVGYSTSRYFVYAFKQYTGLTPKEYYRKIAGLDVETNEE